jgi:UDP-glucose:(heptosyl)LPS alpha-1,3-glucosyltransferase
MMKKIAIIRQKYNPFGGGEKIVEITRKALSDLGLDVYIICKEWNASDKNETDLKIIKLPQRISFTRKGRIKAFEKDVLHLISENSFDLIQSNEMIAGADIIRVGDGLHRSWLERRSKNIGFGRLLLQKISPFHNYLIKKEKTIIEDPTLKAIICNSNMVKQEIIKYFDIEESKLHVIYNAVDHEFFRPPTPSEKSLERKRLGLKNDEKVALFLGSGYFRKGLQHLLASMQLTSSKIKLIVVGADKNLKYYQRLACEKKIQNRIIFVGPCHDARPFLWAADFMVMPTLYDPGPNAMLEGMACGLSVITTPHCGCTELLANNGGMIIPADNHYEWANAMSSQVYSDQKLGPLNGMANRKIAIELNHEKMSSKLLTLYQSIGEL